MNFSPRVNKFISDLFAFPSLPELLAGLAALVYLIQSVWFAHTQWSVLDEGNYIYKGWLFVTGQYIPYQDYGLWTNHMPLSFLFFGVVQLLFGPGLRTIRYFMIFVGCLFMLAMWLASRRLAGRWAAAACLWFLALDPFLISDYSVGIAEGLVACILAWMLYFTLGEDRSPQELFAGSLLAATLVLTRENMILILPFLFLYIFWQHGKKTGLTFLSIVICLLLAVHIFYWPGIVRVWASWMPKEIRSSLGAWVYQGLGRSYQPVKSSFFTNLFVVFSSIQANFLVVFAPLAVWLSWPRDGFKTRPQFKIVVFLSVVFIILYLGHAWASLGKDYCSFCLVNYVTFFSPIGLLLFFAFLPGIKERQPLLPAWLTGTVILLLIIGIGYANQDTYGQSLASISVPKISNFGFQPGTTELWRVLVNKFNLTFRDVRILLPALAGLLAGILILGISYMVAKWSKEDSLASNPVYALISVTMLIGIILSPTLLLGGIDLKAECRQDIINSYEQIGAELAQHIPSGSQVYWKGNSSPTALLYLPGIKIYPPQLNAAYSLVQDRDAQKALRYGFWNKVLDQQWRSQADVLLISESRFASMETFLSPEVFDELERTSPTFPCAPATSIRVFKRK